MRVLLAALILCATISSAAAFEEPTGAEKSACTPDAFKLCWREFWSADVRARVFACLKKHHHNGELSAACEAVFSSRGL